MVARKKEALLLRQIQNTLYVPLGRFCRITDRMPSHIDEHIWQLCIKALPANTPEDVDRSVQELRAALEEDIFMAKQLLEAKMSNPALLDAFARKASSVE
jgi:hypothetical protein